MELLKWLQELRTPFMDGMFSTITHLGEETIFIVLGILFFWCVSKREGYFLLATGLIGTVLNQFLKLWYRIPRPWVLDETFEIVESAGKNERENSDENHVSHDDSCIAPLCCQPVCCC